MLRRLYISILLVFATTYICAAGYSSVDSISSKDSLAQMEKPAKKGFFRGVGNVVKGFIREFEVMDTSYIEPQHFNYAFLLQNTNTYEVYRISNRANFIITFAPDPSVKVGPYFGWKWLFVGYSVDMGHLKDGTSKKNKSELDISLYSSMFGIDLFWKESGDNYKIRSVKLGEDVDTSPLQNMSFDGFRSTIKGFNTYYIFNHRKFSYRAAYSQTTMQKRSAGSALIGLGYTHHSLYVDWNKLDNMMQNKLGMNAEQAGIDSSKVSSHVRYSDLHLTGGYTYNWVFAPHFLFNISLSLGLAYNHSTNQQTNETESRRVFNLKNINLDGIGRFALVYNNNRWFAGVTTILHGYNYHKDEFYTNNFFGTLNSFVGVNFGRIKKKKK